MSEKLELVKKAFDEELVSETMDFNALGWPERIGWLIEQAERVDELENVLKQCTKGLEDCHNNYEGLYEENKQLREALEFYADEENHLEHRGNRIFGDVFYDRGEKARQALEEAKNARD